ncbi:MAG: SDR family oxidoreductase [Verrucomicrobiota bacterium]
MNVVVFGASGLAGYHAAVAFRARGHHVSAFYHQRKPRLPGAELHPVDASDPESVVAPLLSLFPDIIVNAAAVSSPGAVDVDPEGAEKLNVALPRRLAQVANHLGGRLIHLSTDMVFDGTAGPYRSSDKPCPHGLYGQTKLLAEREVLKNGQAHATVLRIPILTGDSPSGERSVHEKLFQSLARGDRPTLYTDEIRQPLAAANLGEVMVELAERGNLSGLFHWAGNEALSRYDMGQRILAHFSLPEALIQQATVPPGRPKDLRFELHPLRGKLKTPLESFDQQLKTMTLPASCREWYATQTGREAPLPRLREGIDF